LHLTWCSCLLDPNVPRYGSTSSLISLSSSPVDSRCQRLMTLVSSDKIRSGGVQIRRRLTDPDAPGDFRRAGYSTQGYGNDNHWSRQEIRDNTWMDIVPAALQVAVHTKHMKPGLRVRALGDEWAIRIPCLLSPPISVFSNTSW
jgi:hypothetical protein